ncbi:hypothetical protein ACFW3D_18900 [Streptomyces sp. NPDC058864]
MMLLLGAGAIAAGIYLRRRVEQAPTAPVVRGPDRHGRRKTDKIIANVAPYFLIFWGSAFVLGAAVTLIDR